MQIPRRLDELLSNDQGLHGAVKQTLARFRPWIADNKLPFFPDYTDHGPVHVESVMRGAEGLISDASWEHLTAHDAGALVLSILLHDCAMHLSEDGFLALVSPGSTWRVKGKFFYDSMQDRPWPELWSDFRREAARFDENKNQAIFGQRDPVSAPPEDPAHWTKLHRLYVGEFLRRHHARLAHEIALAGVPGPKGERIRCPEMPEWFVDLAGFIARSHHLDLRKAVDRMPRGSKRDYRGVHGPFVMAVLRIADYVEIAAPRAPAELLNVKSLRSPISRAEWSKHAAVEHVKVDEDDPEALWVDAEPKDVQTFLGLQRLFRGIQGELDATWASLGEVYGADKKLRELGLVVRRIRSTLDDVAKFGEQVEYLPVDARFRVSGGDVLKLLVGPLYGNEPAFGVRELMQNAVDACREREDYEKQNPDKKLDLAELEADVVVFLEENEDGTGWLTVEDRGIGMTPEVVLKYFLTAGASFRNSEAWHKRHDDAEGKSRVLRTGRFGVGVLAAFLVGDEIHVSTRNVEADRGVEFTCRLEENEIELRWCERRVGTTMRVRIQDQRTIGRLLVGGSDLDWYWLDSPSMELRLLLRRRHDVTFRFVGPTEGIAHLPRRQIPSSKMNLPFGWVRVYDEGYEDIQWLLPGNDGAEFVCNGFVLRAPYTAGSFAQGMQSSTLWAEYGAPTPSVAIKRPLVSLFDSSLKTPVNLLRTGLTTSAAPCDGAVLASVCRDIIGALLVRLPVDATRLFHPKRPQYGSIHPLVPNDEAWSWLWSCQSGVGLTDAAMLEYLANRPIGYIPRLPGSEDAPIPSWLESVVHDAVTVHQWLQSPIFGTPASGVIAQWAAFLYGTADETEDSDWSEPEPLGPLSLLAPRSTLLIVHRPLWNTWRQEDRVPPYVCCAFLGDHWVLEWTGEDKRHLLDLDRLASVAPFRFENPVGIWFDCEGPKEPVPESPLAKAWKEIIRHPVIPWDLAERRRVLAHAYEELKEEVARWEKITAREREEKEKAGKG